MFPMQNNIWADIGILKVSIPKILIEVVPVAREVIVVIVVTTKVVKSAINDIATPNNAPPIPIIIGPSIIANRITTINLVVESEVLNPVKLGSSMDELYEEAVSYFFASS